MTHLLAGKVSRCELVAVCNRSSALPDKFKSLKTFTDGGQIIKSGEVDAVIIATPHVDHLPLGLAAFEHGVHAMVVEKPVAAKWKADAERLIAAHKIFLRSSSPECSSSAPSQHERENPQAHPGRPLGQMVRFNWINTDWFRTEAYYTSSAWRATWKGEGGGVLLNQCLHNLDTLQWLCGMPARVRGFCQLGRFHHIEVEDNVTIYLEWPNGATGTFVSSTGEAPGTNRLEIVGTRGTLVLENNGSAFTRATRRT